VAEANIDAADAHGITLASGEHIETDTIIWAAGVQANALNHALGIKLTRHGQIVVDPKLRVPDHPQVFAAGDLAAITQPRYQRPLPMLAPVAIQTGRHAGEQVARLIEARPLRAFRYRDKGLMAVLGRGDAVAELFPTAPGRYHVRFGGRTAWLLWLGVHIVYLIGFRNRLSPHRLGVELLDLTRRRSDPPRAARHTTNRAVTNQPSPDPIQHRLA
jgi:NADH dehydrogenase